MRDKRQDRQNERVKRQRETERMNEGKKDR